MPSGYHYRILEQRCQIETLLEMGASLQSIARVISCHISTINREVKRNAGQRGYRMKPAQHFADRAPSCGLVRAAHDRMRPCLVSAA